MYLAQLNIWNFRKFGTSDEGAKPGLSLKFSKNLNLLVGENDSGKSCILDAIKHVIFTHYEWIRLDYNDFHVPPDSTSKEDRAKFLKVECIFKDFEVHEAKTFLEWLGFDENGEYFLKVWIDAIRKETTGFEREIICETKAGPDDIGSQMSGEARRYLRATYLKALRDAENELAPKKGSRLSTILYSHEEFEDKEEHDLTKIMRDTNQKIHEHFHNPNKSTILETVNVEYLEKMSTPHNPVISDFYVADVNLRRILEKLELKIKNHETPELNTVPGLGTNNLLFIAAELLLLKKEKYPGLKLALIEEIEAHLHPQSQLRLIEFLQETELSFVQLIMTTHSPNLASKINLESLIICKDGKVFPMGRDYTLLCVEDYNFLRRFLDSTKSNLFFANGVIIVEGFAENLVIPAIADAIDLNLSKYGVSIVNVGSSALFRYAKIFHRKDGNDMGIPVSCVLDRDIPPDIAKQRKLIGEQRKTESSFDETSLRERQRSIEERYNGFGVKCFVSPAWTFEYDMALGALGEYVHMATALAKAAKSKPDGLTQEELNECVTESKREYAELRNTVTDAKELALCIYEPLLKKQVSKAAVAQYLAELSRKDSALKEKILSDTGIKYIVNAIEYATGTSLNRQQ